MEDIMDMQQLFALPLDGNMDSYNKRIVEARRKLKNHLFWEHKEAPFEINPETLEMAHYHHMQHSFWPSNFEHDIGWWGIDVSHNG